LVKAINTGFSRHIKSFTVSLHILVYDFVQTARPANRRLKNIVLLLFKNSRFEVSRFPGYADVRASAVMSEDIIDDVNDSNFDDTLSEILGTSSRVATSTDLDLAFGAVDVNVDLACTSLLSSFSHLPPPISSPPSSAAAGEPI